MKIKIIKIVLNLLPVILMITLIPFIKNDYSLAAADIVIIIVAFLIKYEKGDDIFFLFGLVGMTVIEYIFLKTKVEFFLRYTLFKMMPLWLPILWGYAFVVIHRATRLLDKP